MAGNGETALASGAGTATWLDQTMCAKSFVNLPSIPAAADCPFAHGRRGGRFYLETSPSIGKAILVCKYSNTHVADASGHVGDLSI